jgi:hypothetical protein
MGNECSVPQFPNFRNIDPSGEDCITTSNQTSSGVEVTTERGGSAETCSGTYVEGTVNTNSYQYNGQSLGYSFANDTSSGAGTISFGLNQSDWGPGSSNMLGARQIGMTAPIGNALGIGTAAILTGGAAGAAYGALAGGLLVTSLAIGTPLLPVVPGAIDKLQKIGMSLQQANELIESPTAQKLIDNANSGNINVLQNVGDKVVRITLDPTGSRIISAGYMQSRNVANGIASGRFTLVK